MKIYASKFLIVTFTLIVLTFLLNFSTAALAQSGFVDPNVGNRVYDLVLQPDGKILIIGGFNNVGGQARTKVARLNVDGTLDTSFQNPNIAGAGGSIASTA